MLGLKIGVKVNGFKLLVERTNLATDFMYINGYFDQTRFPVGAIVVVCPSVQLGLTMVKFSYLLVCHREMAVYTVK